MNNFDKVAIIGISIRLPDAKSIDDLDLIFSEKKDCIKKVSAEKAELFGKDPKGNYMPFGYIDDIDKFDNDFFGISPHEAAGMDFQQRIALESACEAIENAGYSLSSMKGTNTAVIVGAEHSGYEKLFMNENETNVINTMTSYISGRISYLLDLCGEAATVSAACTSSMYAVYDAYIKLISRRCDAAISGGITILNDVYDANSDNNPLQSLGILSEDCRCRSFDDSADGIGICEGAVIMMMKRLEDAERDGDNILGVILGMGANQDGGRSTSFTSPSTTAQTELFARVWEQSSISPEEIGYIEAHGTGTRIGDPIEFSALTNAFRKYTDKNHICPVGSYKTNLGHPLYVSGAVGIAKALTSILKKKKYPLRELVTPNKLIDFSNSPLYPITETEEWLSEKRIVGINNFGLSGTNIHMLIGSYLPSYQRKVELNDEQIVCISTKSKDNLPIYKHNVLKTIDEKISLSDIIFTLDCGRDCYPYRDSAVVKNIEDVKTFLSSDSIHYNEVPVHVVLFVSGNSNFTDKYAEVICDKYSGFSNIYSEFKNAASSVNARKIAIDASVIAFLEKIGIKADTIIATGNGKAAVRLYKNGDFDIDDLSSGDGADDFDEADFIEYMSDLKDSEDGNIICIDLHENSPLLKAIRENEYFKDVRTLSVFNDCSIMKCVSELFNAGHNISFMELFRGKNVRRTMLATYPFLRRIHRIKNMRSANKKGFEEIEQTDTTTDLREYLRSSVKDCLKIDELHDDDDFFDLGLNSLISVSLIKKIKKFTGIELETDDFYNYSNIDELYEYLEENAEQHDAEKDTFNSTTIGTDNKNVLSGNQERMLFLIKDAANKTIYNMMSYFRIRGYLDTEVLKASIDEIILENDILHTVYPFENGTYSSCVLSEYDTFFKVIEECDDDINIIRKIAENETSHVFDLGSEIPIRCILIRLASDQHFLMINVHHIACDGWTLGIFLKDLNRIYNNKLRNIDYSLNERKFQYADFALNEKEYLGSDSARSDIEFWKDNLNGIKGILKFPINKPRPSIQQYSGSSVFFTMPKETVDKITKFCRYHKISKFAFFESAYAVLLYRYSGDSDICVGIPAANREDENTESVYGFFANTIPIRSRFEDKMTFDSFLVSNSNSIQNCLRRVKVPFDEIVKHIRCERDPSYSVIYQYFLSYQNFIYDTVTLGDAIMTSEEMESYSVRMDMNFIMKEYPDGIHINSEYDNSLFTKDFMKQITESYKIIIDAILSDACINIDNIPLTSETNAIESHSVLESLF